MNKASLRAFQWDQKCNKGLAHGSGGLRCGHKQTKQNKTKTHILMLDLNLSLN